MKIIVDNSRWSRLKGFSRKLGLKLDNRLSAKIPGIEFSKRFKRALQSKRWDGCQHFFNRLNGKFPTGMIPFVQMLLKKSVFIENERTEKNERILAKARKRFDKLRLDPKPRKEQNEAILNALTKGRGLICMATNAGKTLVACGILESLRKKALYIVHTKDLLKQTVYNLKTKTSLKITMVGDGAYNWDGDVVVAMVQTLTPMLKRKKALMKSLSKFRVFICDEAHHQTAKTWYKLAMLCPAWFRFGMSGTIPKDLYDKFRIQSAV
ncbi:MAG: DEAD/DEAH box helicase family protein, partial [Desulfobacterales bacterium]|nr:DEAD/DEAH box helicase family protein [Desulfobacterales bacterium]